MVNLKHQFDLYSFRPDHIKKLHMEIFRPININKLTFPKGRFIKKIETESHTPQLSRKLRFLVLLILNLFIEN